MTAAIELVRTLPWLLFSEFVLVLVMAGAILLTMAVRRKAAPVQIGLLGMGTAICILELSYCLLLSRLEMADAFREDAVIAAIEKEMIVTFPFPVLLLLSALCALDFVLGLFWVQKAGERMISLDSVKESMDDLSSGILFADEEGKVVFQNLRMKELCLLLTGAELTDSRSFWETIREKSEPVKDTGERFVRLSDGRVFMLRQRFLLNQKEKRSYEQMTAVDMTEEDRLHRRLESERARQQERKERMQAYNRNVVQVTRDEEILAAKILVHDEIGHALLATRRYLENPDTDQGAHVLTLWREVGTLLSEEKAEEGEDALANLLHTAEAIGVRVVMDGPFPEEGPERDVLLQALHESITNLIRHAGGDTLYVNLWRNEEGLTMVMTNNGSAPKEEIVERGGLKYLRERVERHGGIMRLQSRPVFVLSMSFLTDAGGRHILPTDASVSEAEVAAK